MSGAKSEIVKTECTPIVRARNSYTLFCYRKVVEVIGGQGRNRTADAGLFRAAYRIAEVV